MLTEKVNLHSHKQLREPHHVHSHRLMSLRCLLHKLVIGVLLPSESNQNAIMYWQILCKQRSKHVCSARAPCCERREKCPASTLPKYLILPFLTWSCCCMRFRKANKMQIPFLLSTYCSSKHSVPGWWMVNVSKI